MRKWFLILLSLLFLSACVPDVVRYNQAGNQRFAAKAYPDAINEYRQAQVAEPDLSVPYYNAANAYNRQGEIDAALVQTQQALKNASPELAAKAWYNLGNAYYNASRWDEAIASYQESLHLKPDDQDTKHNLELAQRKQEEQRQQEQQSQGNQQDQTQNQDQNPQSTPTQSTTPAAQSSESTPTPQGGEQTQQPPAQGQQDQSMSPEQAAQLLQNLLNQSQTLQEKLNQIHEAEKPIPEKDW